MNNDFGFVPKRAFMEIDSLNQCDEKIWINISYDKFWIGRKIYYNSFESSLISLNYPPPHRFFSSLVEFYQLVQVDLVIQNSFISHVNYLSDVQANYR